VPPADLVDQFVLYTKGRRSTALYRKWCAITMIGGAMESRIDSWFGSYHNFANLLVMLIGDPGSGKSVVKATADLWRSAKDEYGAPAFFVGSNDYTKSALVDALSEATQTYQPTNYVYHSLLLPNDEFANSFPVYDPAFLSFLSTVWDADQNYEERRRKNGKPIVITNPIMTCLFGYQAALLHKTLIKEANDQGLLRRTILIWNEHIPTNSLLEGSPPDLKLKQQICDRLSEIRLMAGTMKWETNSDSMIDKWEQAGGLPRPIHPHLANYVKTRPQFLIKLAMIASISESFDMSIYPRHVERALSWLLEAETIMPEVFESMKSANSDVDTLEAWYAYALLYQHNYFEHHGQSIVPDGILRKWIQNKVPSQKIPQLLNHMEAIGSFTRKEKNWFVTGISPKQY
jgi:hypothetical protein